MQAPAQYLQPTLAPVPTGRTNGALAGLLLEYKAALESCNLDKSTVLFWQEETK